MTYLFPRKHAPPLFFLLVLPAFLVLALLTPIPRIRSLSAPVSSLSFMFRFGIVGSSASVPAARAMARTL